MNYHFVSCCSDLCSDHCAYLVHLESRRNGLNETSASDRSTLHANVVLGKVEDIVPQSSLKVALHLGQVEVRTSATLHELLRVVVEVDTKVEKTARDGFAIDGEVLLLQVPATVTRDECGQCSIGAQLVLLLALLEVNLLADSIVEVELAVDHIIPSRGVRVCKIVSIALWFSWKCTNLQSPPCMSKHPS